MRPIQRILVCTDFGDSSAGAVAYAIDLAKRLGADLGVMHCFEIPSYVYAGMVEATVDVLGPVRGAAEAQLAEEMTRVREELPAASAFLRSGDAYEQVLATARAFRADLIVMGTHGRRGVARLVIGSVAEKVVRMSEVPVLTIRGAAKR